LHLVGYFHNYITINGFTNVNLIYTMVEAGNHPKRKMHSWYDISPERLK